MELDTYLGLPKILFTRAPSYDLGPNTYLSAGTYGFAPPTHFNMWRVVAFGFSVAGQHGISGQDPTTAYGVSMSDIGGTDYGYFGGIKQDWRAGKHFTIGDMFIHDPLNFLRTPLPLAYGGTPTVTTTSHFLEWQTVGAVLAVNRSSDHTLGILPYICIEVRR